MADYRLYFLDQNNHVRHVVPLADCADDEAAIRTAVSHSNAQAMELWLLDRLVRRFEPDEGELSPRDG